jgi:hypothetical protein
MQFWPAFDRPSVAVCAMVLVVVVVAVSLCYTRCRRSMRRNAERMRDDDDLTRRLLRPTSSAARASAVLAWP